MNVTERIQTKRPAQTDYCGTETARRSATERVLHAVYGDKLLLTAAITCAILSVSGFYLTAFFGYQGIPLPDGIDRMTWAAFGGLTALLTAATVKSQDGRKPPGR